jgi:hypothetical protein
VSDGFAIAAVTAVIRRTLLEAFSASNLSDVTGPISVTAEPPDRVIQGNGPEPTQVNIFLHQVSTNAGFRNMELPSRNQAGDRVSGEPLAIDLHYFVTAYGSDMFEAEMLLGHAALALHENATLTREGIARALSPVPPDPSVPDALTTSGIESQMELIKILPEAVATEDMSRLWSAIQGQYRPTIAYRVSVLLIEPRGAGAPALPVRSPGGGAVAVVTLRLDSVEARTGAADPILFNSTVVLSGRDFVLGEMTVEMGDTVATPADEDIATSSMSLDLSGFPVRAGIQAVRAVRTRQLEPAPATPVIDFSNTLAVAIRPQVTGSVVNLTDTDTVDGVPVASGDITLTLSPAVGRRQAATVLLNTPGAPGAHRLNAPPNNGAADGVEQVTEIAFPFRRIPRGTYLMRLSVDGAESLLTTDGGGVYDGPEVTL